ncbi:hypothetical protein OHU45_37415 [Streptomyces tubercidicus]|uniref:hypothetical protein n=1 Tax=Streptomyces tubercidicus TaxID=47759 RepID=UPI0030E1C2DC
MRRVDFEWMHRLGRIEPVAVGRVQFRATKADAAHVPRFSTGHVDDLPQQHPQDRLVCTAHPEQGPTLPTRRSMHRTGEGSVLTGCGSLGLVGPGHMRPVTGAGARPRAPLRHGTEGD